MTISTAHSYGALHRTQRAWNFVQSHVVALNVATALLVAAAVAGYIVQVNGSVAKGYAIRELEDTIRELSLSNQRLEATARESRSLELVERGVKMLGMERAGTPVYLSRTPPAVALAR